MGDNLIYEFANKTYKLVVIVLAFILFTAVIVPISVSKKATKPITYDALLETIAKGESQGNYNAYFGNAENNELVFTKMKLAEVLEWQKNFVERGSRSSAVGKYQFIRPTLTRLVKDLNIDRNSRFDENLQDKLAVALLEKRGLNEYVRGKIDRKKFAHNLSKEWAALPKVIGDSPTDSYYEGDGLNHARVSVNEVYDGINSLKRNTSTSDTLGSFQSL